ncbi:MAG: hypothetical protein R3F11_31915 [Verrucomicrobiales bacterium]
MTSALGAFGIYLAGVFVLAWWSNRLSAAGSGGFVSEYFLGRRNFGMWAFALTFAATNASGGTFIGFPALIYSHGWSLAWWIASFMMVPLVGMGLLGKRLNSVARRARAVTIPEMIEERFGSRAVGSLATWIVIVFMFFYLLAQFKAGAKILSTLLADVPAFQQAVGWIAGAADGVPLIGAADPAYLLCLVAFAASVIAYVVYGGFRAVVWTDVMQGFVMFAGVVIMLGFALSQAGGLGNATRQLAEATPPEFATARLAWDAPAERDRVIRRGTWLPHGDTAVKLTADAMVAAGAVEAAVPALALTSAGDVRRVTITPAEEWPAGLRVAALEEIERYKAGAGQPGTYLSAPGPHRSEAAGFLPLTAAFSLFVFWAFGATGQPANMVRLMAFKDTPTLRRSIVTVAIYYSVIYFSLVVVFCCARVLLPGMENDPDRIMPEFAAHLTAAAGWPWLAGLLLAAPFAAVMSSVDSYLLMVSSSLVRDVYQRRLKPDASEKTLRRLAHGATALIGAAAFLAILDPPDRLQDIIIFASGGIAGCLLVPMVLALYWPRMNAAGMVAGMLGGFAAHAALTCAGYLETKQFKAGELLGIDAFVWDIIFSAAAIAVASITAPPPRAIIARFFGRPPA